MNWLKTTVGEFCPFIYGKSIKKDDQVDDGIPVYGSNGIYTYVEKKLVGAHSVVIGRKGTVGKVHISNTPCWVSDTAFYVENKSLEEAYFTYYLLSSLGLEDMNTDAAVPGLNRNNAHRLEIEIPGSERERKELIQPLINLDEKIQLNRQINQTLEQISQALFKSWFVDFDPVKEKIEVLEAGGSEEEALLAAMQVISSKNAEELAALEVEKPEEYAELRATAELFPAAMVESKLGEIPDGWKVGVLEELLDFNPRRTLKRGTVAPYLEMRNVPVSGHLAENVVLREMGSGTKFINGDTLLARITPCLENGKTAYVDFLDEDQVGWGSTEYIIIRPKDNYADSLGYFIARNEVFRNYAIQSMTGTSGRQRASAKVLEDLPWVIYPKETIKAFDKVAGGYLKLAKSYGDESKQLAELLDTLLPKLLSGEIDVSSMEK